MRGLESAFGAVVQVVGVVRAAAPSPSPTSNVPDDLEVTPGLLGFLATFALAVACVLLFLSLTRHLRRAGRNARERGLPVDEPKRPGGQVAAGEPGTPPAGGAPAAGQRETPREAPADTPPDSPVDWPDDGRASSS